MNYNAISVAFPAFYLLSAASSSSIDLGTETKVGTVTLFKFLNACINGSACEENSTFVCLSLDSYLCKGSVRGHLAVPLVLDL